MEPLRARRLSKTVHSSALPTIHVGGRRVESNPQGFTQARRVSNPVQSPICLPYHNFGASGGARTLKISDFKSDDFTNLPTLALYFFSSKSGGPGGIRTHVLGLKGPCYASQLPVHGRGSRTRTHTFTVMSGPCYTVTPYHEFGARNRT